MSRVALTACELGLSGENECTCSKPAPNFRPGLIVQTLRTPLACTVSVPAAVSARRNSENTEPCWKADELMPKVSTRPLPRPSLPKPLPRPLRQSARA